MSFCAQHNKKHITNTECRNMVRMEKEDTDEQQAELDAEWEKEQE